MRVGTHNVWIELDDDKAGPAVAALLAARPDVGGLQEWGRSRSSILRAFGKVSMFPRLRSLLGPPLPKVGYVFAYPIGGQPVFVRGQFAEIISVRRIKLSRRRRGVRATYGTEMICRTRRRPESMALLNVHPVAHHDRPNNKAAWLEAVKRIDEWAESWAGYRRFVVGDVNKQGLRIDGLKSCWAGRDRQPTFRHRTIDEVYAIKRADDVEVINTASDHHALVAEYKEN